MHLGSPRTCSRPGRCGLACRLQVLILEPRRRIGSYGGDPCEELLVRKLTCSKHQPNLGGTSHEWAIETEAEARGRVVSRLRVAVLEGGVDRGFDVQACGREDRYGAVLRADEQFDLGAAEDHALGAGADEVVDDAAIGVAGPSRDDAVDEFVVDDPVHQRSTRGVRTRTSRPWPVRRSR